MAIGTSLGAYFEDEFHHQAGMDTPPEVVKPADTGDDNVVPPSIPDPPNPDAVTRVSGPDLPATHIVIHPKDAAVKEDETDIDTSRAPFGVTAPEELPQGTLQGQVLKRQLDDTLNPTSYIQKGMELAHSVGIGDVPMWGMDPETGEFHTTTEGISSAIQMTPMALSGKGFPLVVQLHPQAVEALHEGPDVFRQFMATRGNRQASNITENPDTSNFLTSHPMDPETAANHFHNLPSGPNVRFAHEYEEHASPEQYSEYERLVNDPLRQVPFRSEESAYQDHLDESFREEAEHRQTVSKRRIQEAKAQFENNPEVVKKGNVSLVPDKEMTEGARAYGDGKRHFYNFMSDKGIPGELTVDLSRSRTIHVSWIGTIGTRGPMEVGKSEMKNLFKLLADQYPDAREITGFRVSGARAETGRIGNAAMKIPGR